MWMLNDALLEYTTKGEKILTTSGTRREWKKVELSYLEELLELTCGMKSAPAFQTLYPSAVLPMI